MFSLITCKHLLRGGHLRLRVTPKANNVLISNQLIFCEFGSCHRRVQIQL